nr:MAG TPA: hypothetical protein [Microviridae sp.]
MNMLHKLLLSSFCLGKNSPSPELKGSVATYEGRFSAGPSGSAFLVLEVILRV